MATHLSKSRAKHTEKKKKPLLRHLASDNRIKGLFLTFLIILTAIGIFAVQQKQVYKSEASVWTCARCLPPLCTVPFCNLAQCIAQHCLGGSGGGTTVPNIPTRIPNGSAQNLGEGKGCNPGQAQCKSSFICDGTAIGGNLGNDNRGVCRNAKRGSECADAGHGGSKNCSCNGDSSCKSGLKCKVVTITFPPHSGNNFQLSQRLCKEVSLADVADAINGSDCNRAGGQCFNPAEKRCGPADDPGKYRSSKACPGSLICCGVAGVAANFPKGKDTSSSSDNTGPGNGLPPGPSTGSVSTTGDQINSGGGSASHAPAGKTAANCSISQKPSSITPSGTVKPGSKTLRWSAVSKVTKYKVTVNSTARDVTGTSMPLTVKDKKTYNIKVQAYICGKAGNAKTATIKGDVNKGGTPTGGACKAEGTQCGLHGGSNPGSQCCSKVCIDNKCAAEGTPTAEPTEEPIASIEASLKISLRFQGLNSTSSKKFLSEKTRVTLVHTPSNTVFEPKTVDFRIVDALRWEGEARFAGVASGSGFLVAIKGPQHVQRLICDDQPAETSGSIGGLYKCERDGDDHQIGGITLGRGANILDFDGITQFAGDLPDQDGVIDSLDLANVRQSLGSTESDALEVADLNLDGVVNTADFSLVIQGLERYRADENYTGVQLEEE